MPTVVISEPAIIYTAWLRGILGGQHLILFYDWLRQVHCIQPHGSYPSTCQTHSIQLWYNIHSMTSVLCVIEN